MIICESTMESPLKDDTSDMPTSDNHSDTAMLSMKNAYDTSDKTELSTCVRNGYAMSIIRPTLPSTSKRKPRCKAERRTTTKAKPNYKKQTKSNYAPIKCDKSTNTTNTDAPMNGSFCVDVTAIGKSDTDDQSASVSIANSRQSSDVNTADTASQLSVRRTVTFGEPNQTSCAAIDEINSTTENLSRDKGSTGVARVTGGSRVISGLPQTIHRSVSPSISCHSQPNRSFVVGTFNEECRPSTVHNGVGVHRRLTERFTTWQAYQPRDPCVSCTARDLLQCHLSKSDFTFPNICYEEQRKSVAFIDRNYPEPDMSNMYHLVAHTNGRSKKNRPEFDGQSVKSDDWRLKRSAKMAPVGLPKVNFNIEDEYTHKKRSDNNICSSRFTGSEIIEPYSARVPSNDCKDNVKNKSVIVNLPAQHEEHARYNNWLHSNSDNTRETSKSPRNKQSSTNRKIQLPAKSLKSTIADINTYEQDIPNKYNMCMSGFPATFYERTDNSDSRWKLNKTGWQTGNGHNHVMDYRPPTSRYKYRASVRNSIYESCI